MFHFLFYLISLIIFADMNKFFKFETENTPIVEIVEPIVDKGLSIFDHLKNITIKKRKWETYTEAEKKSFQPFMINRWLSMNPDYIEFINSLQKFTIGNMTNEQVYKLYYYLLPKQNTYSKYIKGNKEKKYNPDLVDIIKTHYKTNEDNAIYYLDIYFNCGMIDQLKKLIKNYGNDEKTIKKLIKI